MADVEQHVQRNFLGDFDTMLSVLGTDYIACARFETSGYAEFIGKLYTMNSGMFQSPIYCDHMLTQSALHYLTWFQDPALRFEVGPKASWHVDLEAWKLQRHNDQLYVLAAPATSGVRRGERIVAINGQSLEKIREEVERTLWTTVSPADPEREDWSVVLAFANHATVLDAEGSERKVHFVPGDSAVTGRMREVYAKRSGQTVPAALDDEPRVSETDSPACEFSMHGGVAVLRLNRPGAVEFDASLKVCLDQLGERLGAGAGEGRPAGLVIDVRGTKGGVQEDIYPLVGWVLAPGAAAKPADLFGEPGIVFNYSRRNVAAKLAELQTARDRLVREEGDQREVLAELDDLVQDLMAKKNKGLLVDKTDFYPELTFAGAQAEAGNPLVVAVLTDRDTADAAEWLVRAAKSAGYARVMGRATRGSLDHTCLRTVRLDDDFAFTFPTARYLSAVGEGATLGRGIAPVVHIAWTPEQLEHDVELERACEQILA